MAKATHIDGGEFYYKYVGVGSTLGTVRYTITLRLFRDNFVTGMAAQLPPQAPIGIFNVGSGTLQLAINLPTKLNTNLTLGSPSPCIISPPAISYQLVEYEATVELPLTPSGYSLVYQRCCRANNLGNLSVSMMVGASYVGAISGTNLVPNGQNSSPVFNLNDTALVCSSNPFAIDFGAIDSDGDSLVYSFCDAYIGGTTAEATPTLPFNNSVPYGGIYSGGSPLGAAVTINPQTGLISGIAPAGNGKYIVCVCIAEYRGGILVGNHRKDFMIKLAPCSISKPDLDPEYVNCDTYTKTFENNTPIPPGTTILWDFGVPGIITDQSTDAMPTYTYPDTGTYVATLTLSRGGGACVDSAKTLVKIYPGFFPSFTFTGACFSTPFNFVNTSTTSYGVINYWRYNFGDLTTLADTALTPNASYNYNALGPFTAELIIKSNKGCIDTVTNLITPIDKPIITLPFIDTIICSIDTLQLFSNATSGTPTWSPNYNFLGASNVANPRVYPRVTTTYVVEYNDLSCRNRDSIKVNVVNFVSLKAPNDTVMCRTDTILLRPTTDATSFIWSPNIAISSTTIKNPKTYTQAPSQKYYLTANIGLCQAKDSVTITTVPYPTAVAFADTTICLGGTANLLGVTNGNSHTWRPTTGIANPLNVATTTRPTSTTTYIFNAFNTLGCPKPSSDTVTITLLPAINIFAGNDTTIVRNQPLQLNAIGSGGSVYQWLPATNLTNATITNPIANGLQTTTNFIIRLTNPAGCFNQDSINVTVFLTAPSIFVPSAFTPNADGKNDIGRAVGVGLKSFTYFSIYNRYGHCIFNTKVNGQGWDGKINGVPQGTNTFVYVAAGVTYDDKIIKKQGTITLIR